MKILKKIKLKHVARCLLVFAVFVFVTVLSCSAAASTTVTLTNPNNIPFELNSIPYYSSFNSSFENPTGELQFGDSISLNLQPIPVALITVIDGLMSFVNDSDAFVSGVPVDVADGLYTAFFGLFYYIESYSFGLIVPESCDYYNFVAFDGFGIYNFVFYDEIPSNIDLIVVEDDVDVAPFFISFFLVPYVPVIDDVGSVWTSILTWIVTALNVVTGVFWNGSGFTLIGTLAMVGTIFALCLLVFNKVKDFLNLR